MYLVYYKQSIFVDEMLYFLWKTLNYFHSFLSQQRSVSHSLSFSLLLLEIKYHKVLKSETPKDWKFPSQLHSDVCHLSCLHLSQSFQFGALSSITGSASSPYIPSSDFSPLPPLRTTAGLPPSSSVLARQTNRSLTGGEDSYITPISP